MTLLCGIYNRHGTPVDTSSLDPMLHSMGASTTNVTSWNGGPIALAFIQSAQQQASFQTHAQQQLIADTRLDEVSALQRLFPGAPLRPYSDVQLISHALAKKGTQCIPKITGEFALAHWHHESGTLTLARDEFGHRPLYIHIDNEQIIFASEAAAIATICGRKPHLPSIAKLSLPMGGLNEPNASCFDGIEAVPAGASMRFTADQVETQYWARPFTAKAISHRNDKEIIDGLKSLLTTVTADKLRGCHHAAVLLSGGLDSTTVAAYAKKHALKHGTKLTFFAAVSGTHAEAEWPDESPWIEQAAKALDIEVIRIAATHNGPFDGLETEIAHAGFPQLSSRHYLYTAFAQACRERDIQLILDGLGGEFGPSFHGNGCLTEWLFTGQWIRFQREIRMLAKVQQRHVLGVIRSHVLRPLLGTLMQLGLGFSNHEGFGAWEQHPLIKPSFVKTQLGDSLRGDKNKQAALNFDALSPRAQQLRNLQYLRGQQTAALPSWRHLHYAYPLADRRVLEYCLAAPAHLKIHNGFTRYLIRAAMPACVPDSIRWRTSKEPFSPDYQRRYNTQRGDALAFINSIKKDSQTADIIDLDALAQLLDRGMTTAKPNNAADFSAMHNVTRAVYLAAFLQSCSDWR